MPRQCPEAAVLLRCLQKGLAQSEYHSISATKPCQNWAGSSQGQLCLQSFVVWSHTGSLNSTVSLHQDKRCWHLPSPSALSPQVTNCFSFQSAGVCQVEGSQQVHRGSRHRSLSKAGNGSTPHTILSVPFTARCPYLIPVPHRRTRRKLKIHPCCFTVSIFFRR